METKQDQDPQPTWSRWSQIPAVVLAPVHLRKTVGIALVVGTVLFAINQLDIVLSGGANARVIAKIALTYLVPFCVSNYGLLIGRRVHR